MGIDSVAGLNRNALIDYSSATITKREGKAAFGAGISRPGTDLTAGAGPGRLRRPRVCLEMPKKCRFVLLEQLLLLVLSYSSNVLHLAKRGIPLDSHLPTNLRDSHHVLREDEDIWDAKLSLSHSVANKNKFYIIQLLEPDSGEQDKYFVWTRWGRVGESNATVFILAG